MTATTDANGDRDSRGRFVPGNRGGSGNPACIRARALRLELMEAAGPQLPAVAAMLVRRAIEGDVQAARLLLERVLGTARQEPLGSPGFDLGPLGSPAAVTAAAANVARSLASGDLDPDAAGAVLSALDAVRRAHESDRLAAIEQRLAMLEGDDADA